MEEVLLCDVSLSIYVELGADNEYQTISWDEPELIEDDEVNDESRFIPLNKTNNIIAYAHNKITLSSRYNTPPKTYTSNGGFTITELIFVVLDYELLDRPNSEWFGYIDCHHIYFEGLHKNADDSYTSWWGS